MFVILQIDITSYQGVLLIFCTVLFICGIFLAVILPFGYVSTYVSSRLVDLLFLNRVLDFNINRNKNVLSPMFLSFLFTGSMVANGVRCLGSNTVLHGT